MRKLVQLHHQNNISRVVLDRAERNNALSPDFVAQLLAAIDQADRSDDSRVILMEAVGEHFSVGDDFGAIDPSQASAADIADFVEDLQEITRRLMFSDKPVVVAARGWAIGGAASWLLNGDVVVASDTLRCFFPEAQHGIFLSGASSYLMPKTVGRQRALDLFLSGKRLDAQWLQRQGVVSEVVPDAELDAAALTRARALTELPAHVLPVYKRAVAAAEREGIEAALRLEKQAICEFVGLPQTLETLERLRQRFG